MIVEGATIGRFESLLVRRMKDGDAAKFVFLTVLAGYMEIWFPETLKQAMSVPISEVLP